MALIKRKTRKKVSKQLNKLVNVRLVGRKPDTTENPAAAPSPMTATPTAAGGRPGTRAGT